MPIKKTAIKYIILAILAVLISPTNLIAQEQSESLDNLNKSIEDKRAEIKEIKERIEIYETNIQLSQTKTVSLKNQLSILDDQIYKNDLKIQVTQSQLEETNLEINKTNQQIIKKTEQINNNHARLSEFIRIINKNDQQNFLEVLALNNSFTDFFDQLNYLDDIQAQISQTLADFKQKKTELKKYNLNLNNKKDELDTLEKKLLQQQDRMDENKSAKNNLLVETQSSERKFQNNIAKLKAEQDSANSEIVNLEAVIRRRLEALNQQPDGFDINREAVLSWPVSPNRGITTYFHDPDYPFRYIFEHPGLDIRARQGLDIKAAESGYVARAKNNGYGYSYIMIIHGNGLSTVYGHLSRIDVAQDSYVVKGQIIGAVGGMPGTRGAGRLTTGPHLHLEVRKDGIPVNPLEYLP